MAEAKKKQTYCFECHLWYPRRGDRTEVYGRCKDLKQRTMRLDFCDSDKIPEEERKK